jgi:hypothetical protein
VYGPGGTVARMKTTVDLPDALAELARRLAREQGVTLRDLVVSGLRAEVERRDAPRARADFVFPTVEGRGLVRGAESLSPSELAYDLTR